MDTALMFKGRYLVLFLSGAVVLAVLTLLVPTTLLPGWRHSLSMVLIVVTLAPWALSTICRGRRGTYLAFCGVTVGTMMIIEAMLLKGR
jgi:hypothetical protein